MSPTPQPEFDLVIDVSTDVQNWGEVYRLRVFPASDREFYRMRLEKPAPTPGPPPHDDRPDLKNDVIRRERTK